MAAQRPSITTLRAEARLLASAGVLLLGIGFPLTLFLVARALWNEDAAPLLPVAIGAPPILLGYIACHFASARLARAKRLEVR